MKESMILTIEQWSDEYELSVSKEQIEDLADALDVCHEMHLMHNVFQSGVKSEKDKEIERLEKKLRNLELFISSKGISISIGNKSITEHVEERISVSHVASRDIKYEF